MAPTEQEIRSTVATGCRILSANGHDDFVWGHLAVRDPDGRGVWMKAAGLGFDEITEEDVLLVGFDGEVLAGEGRRHAEWPIHTEILALRPDLGAVVHSHPPHALAIAAADQPLRPVSHAATLFVPPEVPRYTRTADLIVTRELGQEVAQALGEEFALLLVNHGIVTAGEDAPGAVMRAVLLEKACQHQVLTGSAGGPKIWSSDEEALRKRETAWSTAHLAMLWSYLERQLPNRER
ncbi:MAG TPA: class II aldolase/adducin family protein [Baekduia sp.]|nr:class II aldolase/adducin family protein [Baekduia sp.]